MNKRLLLLPALFLVLIFQTVSCNRQPNEEQVSLGGANHKTNLVILFKKQTSREEINDFWKNILDIKKYNLALQFQVVRGDYEGVGVSYSTETTLEQREQLKSSVHLSPIVYKVFENVAPSEIKDF